MILSVKTDAWINLLKYWGESYVRVIGIAKVAKYD